MPIVELTLCVAITERCVTHVGQFNVTLRARVHEQVAMGGMELGRSDDFSQLLHVYRFDVHDICTHHKWRSRGHKGTSLTEALVTNVKVPKVYPEIVGGDVGFLIRIYRDGMNMVCMGVGVDLAGNGGDDVVLLGHLWQPEMQGG